MKRPYLGNKTRFFRSAGAKISVSSRAFACSWKWPSATLSPSFSQKSHFFGMCLSLSVFGQNMPPGLCLVKEEKKLLGIQYFGLLCKFCEPNFQEFRLKWWRKELILHCGDESKGNFIFDILEPPAFQNNTYVGWVFLINFLCMYFATRPSLSLTVLSESIENSKWKEFLSIGFLDLINTWWAEICKIWHGVCPTQMFVARTWYLTAGGIWPSA